MPKTGFVVFGWYGHQSPEGLCLLGWKGISQSIFFCENCLFLFSLEFKTPCDSMIITCASEFPLILSFCFPTSRPHTPFGGVVVLEGLAGLHTKCNIVYYVVHNHLRCVLFIIVFSPNTFSAPRRSSQSTCGGRPLEA